MKDLKCGTQSLNVASANINVTQNTGLPTVKLPRNFRIAPTNNPSHGQVLFALDLPADGQVSIEALTVDGRRAANITKAWMPAGKHSLQWRAVDQAGKHLPAGVYMVRARSNERSTVTRVVLVP